jgi:hypothetical protein
VGVTITENIGAEVEKPFGNVDDAVAIVEQLLLEVPFCAAEVSNDWSEPPDSMKGTW